MLIIILALIGKVSGQPVSNRITGSVIDENSNPIPFAVLQLYKEHDTVPVKGVIASERGIFELVNVPAGRYTLRASGMGQKPFNTPGFEIKDTGTVTFNSLLLQPSGKQLTEVVVKGRKPVVEQKIDMTVINVQGSVLAEANNSLEVIQLAPGVKISDNEDQITMNGKEGVDVMINGKLSKLSGRDLVKFLKSMRSNTLQSVEVISNPSSRYDVSGNRGILNIKMKKVQMEGVNGSVNTELSQGEHTRGDVGGEINYARNNFNVYGYLGYHFGKYRTTYIQDRQVSMDRKAKTFNQQNNAVDQWSDPVVRVGADYNIDKFSSVGIVVELEHSHNKKRYDTYNTIQPFGSSSTDSTIYTGSYAPNVRKWNTYNLNYHYTDTSGTAFNVDIDNSFYGYNVDNYLSNRTLTRREDSSLFYTNTKINILTFKADYSREFASNIKLEAGIKFSLVTSRNQFSTSNTREGIYQPDSSRTNNFKYDENVNAGYLNIGKQIGKWGLQLGVRVEQSNVKGIYRDLSDKQTVKPDSTYLNILPTAFLSYLPHEDHAFRLSFSQRIKRPDYESLQPVFYQLDAYSYFVGNPYLKPQKNSTAEFSYTYKSKVTFTASYTRTTDYFNPLVYQIGQVIYQTEQNTGNMDSWNFTANYPFSITKWWSCRNMVTVFYNSYKGQLLQGYLNNGQWSGGFTTTQRFILPEKFILQITARYNLPVQRLIYYEETYGSVGFSVNKKMMGGKGMLRVGCSDLFHTMNKNTTVDFGDLKYTQNNKWESRSAFIEMSYRFGNTRIKQPKERETGNTDERERAGK